MDPTSLDQAYAAPHAAILAVEPAATRLRARSGRLFLLAIAVFAASLVFMAVAKGPRVGALLFGVSAGIAALGAGYGAAAFVKGVSGGLGAGAALHAVLFGGLNVGMMLVGSVAAIFSTGAFTRGRQIRSFGKIQLPHMGNNGTRFQGRMRGQ